MTGEDKGMQNEMKQLVMGEVDMMKAILKGDGVSKPLYSHVPFHAYSIKTGDQKRGILIYVSV